MDRNHRFRIAPKVPARAGAIYFLVLLFAGCGAGSGSGTSGNNIAVSIAGKVTSVQAGTAVVVFTATVQNDSTNSGVSWNLTANGVACSPACGTLSLANSTSVTYTPPAAAPVAPMNQPTLTAASVAKTNKSDSDTFTITAALTVSISNKFSSVNTGASAFVVNATTQNDPTNSGVNWTLTANGAACSPACGTLSGTTATSVTYTPPPSIPPAQPTLTAASVHDSSKTDSFSFTVTTPAIAVAIQGKFNSIIAGSPTVFLEANVTNDPSPNPAVAWTLTAGNVNCQPTCGTLTTVGAAGVRYAPPASVPAPPNNTPTLTATSNADSTKSDSDSFTINAPPPISIAVTKISSILNTGAGLQLSAYVQNDFSNSGVTWTLTCTSPATSCGTLTPGTPAPTYTATYAPSGSAPAQATITATSNGTGTPSDSTTFNIVSSVSSLTPSCGAAAGQESLLNGHYALLLQGFWSGGVGAPSLMAASFQADGAGNITGGEEDVNDSFSPQHLTFNSAGSVYTIGANHLGCLQLTNSGGTTSVFHFSVGGISSGIASKGRLIEFDDNSGNGSGSRGSGILRLQDPNSFSLGALQSQYAFGVDGWTRSGHFYRLTGAGWFTNSGGSLNGLDDVAFTGGIISPDTTGLTGTINPISATTGRATGGFDFFNWAIYIVNSSEFFVVGTDPVSSGTLSAGRVVATANSFTASSLSGNYVVHATGGANGTADASLQLLTMTPGGAQTGTLSGTVYSYGVGSGAQTSSLTSVTYNVDASVGRTTLGNTGDNLPVVYLTTPTDGIAAFLIGVSADELLGVAEPQTSTALPAGTYIFGTEDPSDNTVANKAGVETITSGGVLSGTYDQSNISGLQSGQSVSATVSLGSNGTGNLGPNTVAITSGGKLFSIDETGATSGPAVIVVAEP
jgi:hypothetical protein